MICIFCKVESSGPGRAMPMLPESLNTRPTLLPAGMVCELCQEYFVREVDGPFVAAAGLAVQRSTEQAYMAMVADMLALSGPLLSRLMAKLALEEIGARMAVDPGGVAYLAGETQYDLIRNHARYGTDPEWPVHGRKLYHPVSVAIADNGEMVQVVHECDVLHTPPGEYYFVSVLFGVEFAINYGGPEVEGYESWLRENDNASPLYTGLNARPLPVLTRSNEAAADN